MREESREFRSLLQTYVEPVKTFELDPLTVEESVFTGFRMFSPAKLSAMAVYIAQRGEQIYKNKLNKLLFYSDFINFYLYGRSISGSKYVHVPFGPVPQKYGEVLAQLSKKRMSDSKPKGALES